MNALRFLFLLFFSTFLCSCFAAHEIKIKIVGLSNKPVLLAHYFANKKTKYAEDTTVVDANGIGVFKNSRNLEPGIYLVILPDYRNFEFLLGEKQNLEIETKVTLASREIKFINSMENTEFYSYRIRQNEFDSTVGALKNKIRLNHDTKQVEALNKRLAALRMEHKAYINKLTKKYAGSYFALLLSSGMMEDNEERQISDLNIFSYTGLLNTPYYENKLSYYLDSIIPQGHDTIERTITGLFNNAFSDNTVFRYLCDALINHYRFKKNHEDVYLYIADNYYIPFVDWAEAEHMERIQLDIVRIRYTLVGAPAQNFVFNKLSADSPVDPNTKLIKTSLYQINAEIVVLAFCDPDRDAGRKDLLKLYASLDKLKNKNILLLAINSETTSESQKNWLEFIHTNNMKACVDGASINEDYKELYELDPPLTIYILDKNKKIIARRLAWDEVNNFLTAQ